MTARETSFIDDLSDIPGLNDLSRKPRDTGLRVTGEDADGDYDDSGDDLGTKKVERETFPCESCAGKYRGPRVHQEKAHCFACKGKGFFYQSRKDREASKAKRVARKERVIAEAKSAFEREYPLLLAGMRKHASWNDFLKRLLIDVEAGKHLGANAIAAAERAIAKADARDAEREAAKSARVENAPIVNADQLKAAFDKASTAGLKKPKLRYEGFEVSRAPDTGKNAGALYVKGEDDAYLGKIVGGKYLATREAEAAGIVSRVAETMRDPLALAIAYGKRTGNCSCCGRKLSDPTSVAMGIGPVCAEKYGWSREGVTPINTKPVVVQGEKEAPAPRAAKYDYPEGLDEEGKRKFRAAARRNAKKET